MRRALFVLALAACKPATPTPDDSGLETDADTDADSDADTDTDADTDADTDTDVTGHTGGFNDTSMPTDSGEIETGIFVITCDTADPTSSGIADCNGECWPADYVGDGVVCDDGTVRPWGNPDFNCAAFGWDGGDCPIPETADTGATDTAVGDTGAMAGGETSHTGSTASTGETGDTSSTGDTATDTSTP